MPRDTLTGSRIRERRIMAGMKQAELAREANISASYLNLIEHNRRRIGGKLLVDLARILDVEPTVLTEGAEATLIAALREAAAARSALGPELDRIDEFAGRFPGWAGVLADAYRRTVTLERTVETLSDRLTHDPHLAAALHEMLSTVTAIRSTAAILAEPGDIPADWQRRFHRNVHEDSARLAESSQALVRFLDTAAETGDAAAAPQEQVDAVLAEAGHAFAALEQPGVDPASLAAEVGADLSAPARTMLEAIFGRHARDAAALPLDRIEAALGEGAPDPFALAAALDASPAQVMRRLATLPEGILPAPAGLAICDRAGALVYRKPLPDFPLPLFDAGCPLWPLYAALGQPMRPVSETVVPAGRTRRTFRAHAVAEPAAPLVPGRPALFEAHMLLVPVEAAAPDMPALDVGTSCRICPRETCPARREPSILGPASSGAQAPEAPTGAAD